ncbi:MULTISPECIES: alpha-galactosidase [unclassified Microbispora]|uniref:alpha-galactosidase n=1 Tax=unclassified Microbispora TaxID=2614687 RepID=UPI00197B465B|nr:alpha-galactosidase [Microbispora sp. SCL1-1]
MNARHTETSLVWGHSALRVVIAISPDGVVSIRELGAGDPGPRPPAQPLVEVLLAGQGRARASHRFSDTAVGRRFTYVGAEQARDGRWHELRITLRDEHTGLEAHAHLRSAEGVPAVRSWTTITNRGVREAVVLGVTSFAAGFPAGSADGLQVVRADSEWLGESRWRVRPLREEMADLNLPLHGQDGRGRLAVTSTGAWSTGQHLPTAGLLDPHSGRAWLWQIEHNGPWRWEIGERRDGVYVALLGPTDIDHQWHTVLAPGESFTTVPASVTVSSGGPHGAYDGLQGAYDGLQGAYDELQGVYDGLHGAAAALTAHRRALLRPHPDRTRLPVVFNDYMNTLMGDPTTAKLLPLIDAAAEAGAEVFCIDAGWYDDDGDWWDSVGEWQPSQTRFPRGIEEVLGRIRERGMIPGLWLEPEVIGVRSPMADKLPAEAFLQRGGTRIVEHGRYHLDLRHPAAVAHLDEVVDRLVEQLGVGYFKLDYNIDPGAGTDVHAVSPGAGLLACNRAHLAWLEAVLDRHPGLILENCASGAMRMDYALLSRMQLQSTSDQQDPLRYPPIAVAAPLSVLPEQSASWAYPQPDMDDERVAYSLCTGMLGRLYLSGHLPTMTAAQRESVRAAVTAYRGIRAGLAEAAPVWPLGLPGWADPWLSLGLVTPGHTYAGVWCRTDEPAAASLSLPHLAGRRVDVEVVYPRHLPAWDVEWDQERGRLTLTKPVSGPSARILRISPVSSSSPVSSPLL